MCRSIKVLRTPAATVGRPDIEAASLQFVRKVSGLRKPSKANQAAFDAAVLEITDVTERLLQNLTKPKGAQDQPEHHANGSEALH
ncbi:MAG TPA: DUF2277 domain-containing protein [Bryobacteraceae bacterium]|nr:DUF2277 domain-containing protein [Bryobacteraceae bacterium]